MRYKILPTILFLALSFPCAAQSMAHDVAVMDMAGSDSLFPFSVSYDCIDDAHNWITISGNEVRHIQLFDTKGKLCYSVSPTESPFTITVDVHSLPRGTYLLTANHGYGIFIDKVVLY